MKAGDASFQGRKKAIAIGSLNLVARQKAKEGEDPLKTRMNKGRFGTVGYR
jgi:hypothetical protein